ncbi:helix-turn-helix domain-containing protein [Actinomadura parmotrematis]|uniref:Helix-turn-helix domain-containing protein n=1 Tax=Actinomadura parmotrematis TaxID=2864039 RepID=A0ABS7FZM1_9ACTN|nr:helix-turn-helix transcriptional regulator [Actinomadura parmotrematis]MBW8485900.1 helix-turn-helix domain-containing protein [Actinomadura parmotrematis]
MSGHVSPTVRARRLRIELHRLRQEAGHTLQRVADLSDGAFNAATVGRWETGDRVPRQGDLRVLLEIYGVSGDRRGALQKLAKEAKQRGWWHAHRDMLKDGFGLYVGLESEAAAVQTYQSLYVPGLLQTEDYSRAAIRGIRMNEDPEGLEAKVQLRQSRQQRLTGRDPLRLWAVLDEALVHRQVGGPTVMREQLEKLVEQARLPNVTLQLLPYAAGAHPALEGPFYMLEFPDPQDAGVIYLEQATSGLALEAEDEVRRYTLMFGHLTALALSPEETDTHLTRMIDSYR